MFSKPELFDVETLSRASLGGSAAPAAAKPERRTPMFEIGDAPAKRVRPSKAAVSRKAFSAMAAASDLAAMLWSALGAQGAYNYAVHGWPHVNPTSLRLSCFVALAFTLINIARRNYALTHYLDLDGHARRTLSVWNLAFLMTVFLGFLDRSTAEISRGAFISFYALGLVTLYVSRATMVGIVRRSARSGGLLASRVMIVGYAEDIERLARRKVLKESGKQVVRTYALHEDAEALPQDLAAAVRAARRQSLDEILIAAPMGRAEVVDQCVAAFMQLPVAVNIHIEPGNGLERFAGARVDRMGRDSTLRLPGNSMSSADQVVKRACDIFIAASALVVFAPLMLAVAIAIKLDSPGPVFFLQTRHGFNKKPFRIFKFRSMTAMENGRAIVQATQRDFRVTGMGRFMRKFNIDELPQLVNVLRGEMSLVGPRPHAIAHDRAFAREIKLYPRRHNVKPGITGWAQVNGLRGPTDSLEKITNRVRYDLHYVDNWSLPLDLWILALTLFSRTAYRNAF